jgi:hypothetical protein
LGKKRCGIKKKGVELKIKIKVDEQEKTPNKNAKEVEKTMAADKAANMNLGDYLLEKEYRMNEAAKEILAKHKLDPDKSKQAK